MSLPEAKENLPAVNCAHEVNVMRIVSSKTRVLLAIAGLVLVILPVASAWAYAATGNVTQVVACNLSSSRRVVLAELEFGNGSRYFYYIADSAYGETAKNEDIAMAAMLSGHRLSLNHNGSGQDFCGFHSWGSIVRAGSGRYIRMISW